MDEVGDEDEMEMGVGVDENDELEKWNIAK